MKQQLRRIVFGVGLGPTAHRASRFRAQVLTALRESRLRAPWGADSGFVRRSYASYDAYLEHQRSKLNMVPRGAFAPYDDRLREAVRERMRPYGFSPGTPALCLAARLGGEVRALLDLGLFAVGLDLNPGPENRYVVTGDFHALQFPDASAGLVYCNSLDHALDLERVATEIARVLRPGGSFVAEVAHGMDRDHLPSHYEATFWPSVDALIVRIESSGLTLASRQEIAWPDDGEHLHFRK